MTVHQQQSDIVLVQECCCSSSSDNRRASGTRASRTKRRGERGMLLLDAMLALIVGVFVILAAYSLTITLTASGNAAKQNNLAYNAARQVIENVRHYKAAPLANNVYPDPTVFGPIPQLAELPGSSASVSISTYRKPLKRVSVTITWEGRGNSKSLLKQRTLVTLIGPKGMTP